MVRRNELCLEKKMRMNLNVSMQARNCYEYYKKRKDVEMIDVYAGPEMMEEEDDSKQEAEDSKEKDSKEKTDFNETNDQEYPKNYQSPSE